MLGNFGLTFQSPIHRGNKCNYSPAPLFGSRLARFQSPIHRGNKCNRFRAGRNRILYLLSVPYSSGKLNVTQREYQTSPPSVTPFSPLFIGETNVTRGYGKTYNHLMTFQSPIHRGNKCNLGIQVTALSILAVFQSPIHRGNKCNTLTRWVNRQSTSVFQSPIHRGNKCNRMGRSPLLTAFTPLVFQSPIHRGNKCNPKNPALPLMFTAFSPLFIGETNVTAG